MAILQFVKPRIWIGPLRDWRKRRKQWKMCDCVLIASKNKQTKQAFKEEIQNPPWPSESRGCDSSLQNQKPSEADPSVGLQDPGILEWRQKETSKWEWNQNFELLEVINTENYQLQNHLWFSERNLFFLSPRFPLKLSSKNTQNKVFSFQLCYTHKKNTILILNF